MARSDLDDLTVLFLGDGEQDRLARLDAKVEDCLRIAMILTHSTPEQLFAEHMNSRKATPGWYRLQYKRTQEAFESREVF